jgi:hypothetical protein
MEDESKLFLKKFKFITHVTRIFHFSFLYFNSILTQKNMQLDLKVLNCANKKFENQINFFLNFTITITINSEI